MSTKLTLAAVALALSTGLWALTERDNRLRAEGRAEVAQAAVDSLEGAVELAARVTEEAQAQADSVRILMDSVIQQADSTARVLRERRPLVVDTIIQQAGEDSTVVREAIERVSESYEAEIVSLREATAAAHAIVAAQATENEALEAELRVSRALIANLQAQVEVIGQTRKGWLERNTDRILWLSAGMAAGYIGNEVIGG